MIKIPESYNYISAFLTFACNMKCPYCINKYDNIPQYKLMSAKDWIVGLNRINTKKDLPITLSGGEPTLYPEFYSIVNSLHNKLSIDVLTNGKFDVNEFMANINPNRLKRNSPYASIRFSYHPNNTNFLELLLKVTALQFNGYSVGIWAVGNTFSNRALMMFAKSMGIDFRLKDFLSRTHGSYKYPKGLSGDPKPCLCKPSELLIAPDGRLFRCHRDLYHGENSYGHLLDEDLELPTQHSPCNNFGNCSPCDLKMKYDRFQKEGHCSVEIKELWWIGS